MSSAPPPAPLPASWPPPRMGVPALAATDLFNTRRQQCAPSSFGCHVLQPCAQYAHMSGHMQPLLAASQPTTTHLPFHLHSSRLRLLLQHQKAPGAVRGSLQAPNTPRDSTRLFGCTIQWNSFRGFIPPFQPATTLFNSIQMVARMAMVVHAMVVQWMVHHTTQLQPRVGKHPLSDTPITVSYTHLTLPTTPYV